MGIFEIFAALWLSLGVVKGAMLAQQAPAITGWFVFYTTGDTELSTGGWKRRPAYVVGMIFLAVVAFVVMAVFGALEVLFERTRFFTPYGDPYLASLAARAAKIEMPRAMIPNAFEDWDEYQERMGYDPEQVANGMAQTPLKEMPESIQKVVETARELRDLNQRDDDDVELSEEDEFRKPDDDE